MSHYECKICFRPYQYCECDQKYTAIAKLGENNNEVKMITIYKLLGFEEGMETKVYRCSEGYPTIGKGTKIGPKGAPLEYYTFTVSEKVADAMMEEKISRITRILLRENFYCRLNEDRQIIIQSMAYQMGVSGVAKFENMIKALSLKGWQRAHDEALDSLWAKIQTPERAKRHAKVLLTGNLMEVYKELI